VIFLKCPLVVEDIHVLEAPQKITSDKDPRRTAGRENERKTKINEILS